VQLLTIDGETIVTTPNHPFYTIAEAWIPAGQLQVGDLVRRADSSYGMVEAITFVYQPQPMYNLTVATAHTYFVGEGQWLVHNAKKCNFELQSHGGATGMDVRTKGYHIDSDIGELGFRPFRNNKGDIKVNVVTAMGDHPVDRKIAENAIGYIQSNRSKVVSQLQELFPTILIIQPLLVE